MANKDIEDGIEALKAFHNASASYSGYQFSWTQFVEYWGKKFTPMAEGIGLTARVNDVSMSDVKDIMSDLASQGRGKMPSDFLAFQKAVGQKAQEINWLTIAKDSATGVAGQVLDGAVAVGDSVITTLSTLTSILPLLVVGGVIFFFVKKVKKVSE